MVMQPATGSHAPTNPDIPLIRRLRSAIDSTIGPVLGRPTRYALVDFPDHSNVGDSAIWLGEMAWLKSQRLPDPAYVCTADGYDPDELSSSVPSGPILIHGGGNFGDLWPRHQAFRERICREFPDRVILQMPQSVFFAEAAASVSARAIFSSHRSFIIFVRDAQSAVQLNDFGCRTILCPDMAFCLGEIEIDATPEYWITTLLREDKESSDSVAWAKNMMSGIYRFDWLEEQASAARTFRRYVEAREGRVQGYLRVAEYRLARGLALLAKGSAVATDRLHGHILCILLGLPHLLLDNSYGKLSAFHKNWTLSSRLASFALEPEQLGRWLRSKEIRTIQGNSPRVR